MKGTRSVFEDGIASRISALALHMTEHLKDRVRFRRSVQHFTAFAFISSLDSLSSAKN